MEIGRRITSYGCRAVAWGVPLGCRWETCHWLKGLWAAISTVGDMVPSASSHSQPHGYSWSPTYVCVAASLSCSFYSPAIFTGSPVTPFIIQWEMPSMALKEMLYRSTKGMKWWCHGLSYFCSWSPWTRPVPRTWGKQWPSPAGTLHFHMGCSRQAKDSLCRAQLASGKLRGSSLGNCWLVISFELSFLPFPVFHASFVFLSSSI